MHAEASLRQYKRCEASAKMSIHFRLHGRMMNYKESRSYQPDDDLDRTLRAASKVIGAISLYSRENAEVLLEEEDAGVLREQDMII